MPTGQMTRTGVIRHDGAVENHPGQEQPRGPRPARTPSGRRLSPTRAALLEALQAQSQPTGIPALISMTGLHANTLREHLDGLQRAGLVTRELAPPTGRGRPGWLYSAVHPRWDEGAQYAGLAATLAAVLVRTSPHPEDAAREAGEEWGRRLAREAGRLARPDDLAAREKVTTLFDDMGFAPEPDEDGRDVRLTRCPLLQAAHEQPGVICAVHLGVARGALEEYGAGAYGIELRAFVEPGACLLRLAPRED